MLITSSKYHEQVKHLYWQFNIISTSKYFLLKYGASAGNKTDKKIIKKSGKNMFWWLTNESNPSHFDIFVKCYEIFLYIYAACWFGGGGGLTKKKTQQYFKSSTRLIQIWQHLAHSSKTLYFYIHWTVQDCNKSYVLYNKGVTTVGIEKKRRMQKIEGVWFEAEFGFKLKYD